ncbi:MAG: GNAT family N-acetyltransferase, partial [Oscillospiraceae bacterium]|nr:GNAT family N-acetyltransferase [Oscillospiraceae bacterium]
MIRHAKEKDIPKILDLLSQVDLVHHKGRPDIFKIGRKYNEEELKALLEDKNRPILVSVDENDEVLGYCFCIFERHENNAVLTDIKTLYIDDLCVDENIRGKHIGSELYGSALKLARETGCYNVTLNVW